MAMLETVLKRFEEADEIRVFEKGRFEVVRIGGMTIGRATYQPGWKWSVHVGPSLGASRCNVEHVGLVLSGWPRLRWRTARSTNSAPACSFTFHPDLPATTVGWWAMRPTSHYIFSGLTSTQTNSVGFFSNFLGVLGVSAVNLVSLERIYERLGIGFLNHPLVVVAEKCLQPVGVHDVLAGHVRDGVRRNRRNVPVPQEL